MHKKITFRSMAHSNAIESYINNKTQKIDKFFKREHGPISFDIVLEPHREKHFYKVEFKIHSIHYHCVVQTEGLDMYAMIDEAIHKIIKDITRTKEKKRHDLHLSYV